MELRQYLALIRKWGWLIVLTTAIAAGSSYYYSLRLPALYQATTTVLVGQTLAKANPNANEFQATAQIANAYALLVSQQPILEATAQALGISGGSGALSSKVSASVPGDQLLQIIVTDTDAGRTKLIADEVAHQLILHSPTGDAQKQAEQQRAFVLDQITQLQTDLDTDQKTLKRLTTQAALENDPAKLKDLNASITQLRSDIDNYQKNYASLSALLNSNSSNFLTILAPAQEPTRPVSPNILQNVLFGLIAGLALAAGAIFTLEYLDDTIKTTEDIREILNLTPLGAIARMGSVHEPLDSLIAARQPRAPIAEAYRMLRTNLHFAGFENPTGMLLVTSCLPGEGKTTTVANLGVVLAQAGKHVVLIDADLRRPALHQLFNLPNNVGLSSLFLGDALSLDAIAQRSGIEGLWVITSGPLPPNPAEILDSKQMKEILDSIRADADWVILDSPPMLAVADAAILGARCSGALLVIDAGRTRTHIARRGIETLHHAGVKIYGGALNRLIGQRDAYYYNYAYDTPAETTKAALPKKAKSKAH